jgi:hypothetical protein
MQGLMAKLYPDHHSYKTNGWPLGSWVQQTVNSIDEVSLEQGATIWLNGKWGEGKTTALLEIEKHLEIRGWVVNFQPWSYGESGNIALHMLQEIAEAARNGSLDIANRGKRLFLEYSEVLDSNSNWALGLFGRLAHMLNRKHGTIQRAKKEIEAEIHSAQQPIFVLIDDVDRLLPEEQIELLRTLRTVVDFPNVVYVVAADLHQIQNSLGTVGTDQGREYLEKFVQLQIDLPPPPRFGIRSIFYSRLSREDLDFEMDSKLSAYFGSLVENTIFPSLLTARSAIRLANQVSMNACNLASEGNLADLIAVEWLRIFHPRIWMDVRDHYELICGTVSIPFANDTVSKDSQKLIAEWRAKISLDSPSQDINPDSIEAKVLAMVLPRLSSLREGALDHGKLFLDAPGQHWYRRFANHNFGRFYISGPQENYSLSPDDTQTIVQAENHEIVLETLRNMHSDDLPSHEAKLSHLARAAVEYIQTDNFPMENQEAIARAVLLYSRELAELETENNIPFGSSALPQLRGILNAIGDHPNRPNFSQLYRELSSDTKMLCISLVLIEQQKIRHFGKDGSNTIHKPFGTEASMKTLLRDLSKKIEIKSDEIGIDPYAGQALDLLLSLAPLKDIYRTRKLISSNPILLSQYLEFKIGTQWLNRPTERGSIKARQKLSLALDKICTPKECLALLSSGINVNTELIRLLVQLADSAAISPS